MNILQVFNQYRFRGGEEAWEEEIPRLLDGACQVEELRFKSEDWLGDDAPSALQQISLMGDNPASRKALRDAVQQFQPDALLFHNVIPVGSLGLYFDARELGIPVLQYTHNFRPFSPGGTLWDGRRMIDAALDGNMWPEIRSGAWQGSRLKTAILAWHLKRALRKGLLDCVDHWLAISDFMREQFIRAGIPPHRIRVLRHCWSAPAAPSLIEEGDYYLYLGRLVPEKGIESMVAAWRILESDLGADCPKLVIAGSGPLENDLQQASIDLRSLECVGHIEGDAKQGLIESSRAILIPSICWESLGLTVYEAYAAGRPAIASKAGALQETVLEGKTGWSHQPSNSSDIAKAIRAAEAAGSEGRRRFGNNGHQWLKENADPEQWRQQFLSLCQQAIQDKAASKA